jgi:hypothetical protein
MDLLLFTEWNLIVMGCLFVGMFPLRPSHFLGAHPALDAEQIA